MNCEYKGNHQKLTFEQISEILEKRNWVKNKHVFGELSLIVLWNGTVIMKHLPFTWIGKFYQATKPYYFNDVLLTPPGYEHQNQLTLF